MDVCLFMYFEFESFEYIHHNLLFQIQLLGILVPDFSQRFRGFLQNLRQQLGVL